MRAMKLFGIFAIAFVSMSAAQAQQVGTYSGSTDDGSAVLVLVSNDTNTGKLEVTSLYFAINMTCKKTSETLSDIGLGLGSGLDIADDGTFSYNSGGFFYIDLVAEMTFLGTQRVKGKVGANVSSFVPAIGHSTLTKKTQPCISPVQHFTATFSGADNARALPPGTVSIRYPNGIAAAPEKN